MKIQIKRLAKFVPVVSFLSLAPLVASAQQSPVCDTRGGLYNILCRVHDLLGTVVPLLIALGVVYLVYGIVTYVIAGDEEAKTTGRDKIISGIIGLAVIVSIWGLVYMVTNTFRSTGYSPEGSQLQKLIPSRPSGSNSNLNSNSNNTIPPYNIENPN